MTEIAHTMELANFMCSCPEPWQNFMNTTKFSQDKDFDKHGDVKIRSINRELRPYNGKYREHGPTGKSCLQFTDQQGYAMFLLKYS